MKSMSRPGPEPSRSSEKLISGLGLNASRFRSSAASGSSSTLALLILGDMIRLPPLPPACGEEKMSEESAGKGCRGSVVRKK